MRHGMSRIKLRRQGGAYLYLPAALIRDPSFPFEHGDIVKVEIRGNSLLLTKPDWWEMIDWDEMPEAYERLPEEIKRKIREKGLVSR